MVGCTARVTEVVRRYDDGRLDILTCGQRPFEIHFTDDEKPYLRGAVTYLEDDDPEPPPDVDAKQAWSLFREVMKRLAPAASPADSPPDCQQLSFRISAALPLGIEFKQQVLALHSERERIRLLTHLMEKLIPALDLRERTRSKASGNGHITRLKGS